MAGRRNHLFTLERRVETLDAHGEATLTYTTLGTAWGSLLAASARERLEAQQVKADVTHHINADWSANAASLTPADRLTLGTRTFDIISVLDPSGRSRELDLTVKEHL